MLVYYFFVCMIAGLLVYWFEAYWGAVVCLFLIFCLWAFVLLVFVFYSGCCAVCVGWICCCWVDLTFALGLGYYRCLSCWYYFLAFRLCCWFFGYVWWLVAVVFGGFTCGWWLV